MTDFTTILNKGQRRYIDKHLKKRKFGRCDGCEQMALLIEYVDNRHKDKEGFFVCEHCYNTLLNDEFFK